MRITFRVGSRHLHLSGVLVFFLCHLVLHAQDRSAVILNSELGRENLRRVAASAVEIKAVLVKDPGLMVEIRRWLATEATGHGQIISDAELTDDAIFDRLEKEVLFRSAVTLILQKYGYLVPVVNPNSRAAKEQEFLFQQRSKLIAANQEDALAARKRSLQGPLNQTSCDPQLDSDCNVAKAAEEQGSVPPKRQEGPSGERNPFEAGPLSILRTSRPETLNLTEEEDEAAGTFPPLKLAADYQSILSLNGEIAGDTSSRKHLAGDGEAGLISQPNSEKPNTPDGFAGHGVETATLTAPGPNARGPEAPDLVRAPNPYKEIPSLYDMYIQAVPRPPVPKRFGAEVFEKGTRDPQLIPMDLPAGPDYVVGPGDALSIDLWGGVTQRIYRVVDREGRVSLPEVGPLLVSGKSLADVQAGMQQTLRLQFRNVSADVSLARLRTVRIYEVGDIQNPGAYDVSSLSTPLNALFAAGGPTEKGSLRSVRHLRGTQLIEVVDLYDLLLHGVKSDLLRLENGDTVLVPPIGPQVTVEGMVRRPAIYELKGEKNLAAVLELAGGLLPTATLRHIEVQRLMIHEKQTMLSLDCPEGDNNTETTKFLQSFEIRDGDRIRVFPIAPYNQGAVYLEGHVIRPGRYAYRENMRVTDIIASYKDLLPEPANQYAELIHLNPPDFHPTVESFDLASALAHPSQAPVLQAMDTVRVFSRFDFENPPSVSVLGEVRHPGTYSTAGQIYLRDAVHLAGGVSPNTKMDDVQVFRYLPDGNAKIFSVSLSQALAGDPDANILLQPRDRLLLHRNPEAIERASVLLQGEVGEAGRYPYTTNMTVADLVRVGGGLRPSADSTTADVTHYYWGKTGDLAAQHQQIALSAALSGDPKSNLPLSNGDVVTIRQLPGWNDLGASITVKGEVMHPGSYGIRPGERLSSVLRRAGGFQPNAYAYGAVLQRTQVRELEAKEQMQMILRVKALESNLELLPDTDPQQKKAKEMSLQQYQSTLTQLASNPPSGRVAIHISSNINQWKGSAADLEVRADDTLIIPKQPGFVMVSGQVFNPTAVSYRQGKNANWYLSQSGGPTPLANKKAIFVVRADGSVLGGRESLWSGHSLSQVLQPGDTVFVPEKAIGGGVQWQSVLLSAQVASAVASSVFIALRY